MADLNKKKLESIVTIAIEPIVKKLPDQSNIDTIRKIFKQIVVDTIIEFRENPVRPYLIGDINLFYSSDELLLSLLEYIFYRKWDFLNIDIVVDIVKKNKDIERPNFDEIQHFIFILDKNLEANGTLDDPLSLIKDTDKINEMVKFLNEKYDIIDRVKSRETWLDYRKKTGAWEFIKIIDDDIDETYKIDGILYSKKTAKCLIKLIVGGKTEECCFPIINTDDTFNLQNFYNEETNTLDLSGLIFNVQISEQIFPYITDIGKKYKINAHKCIFRKKMYFDKKEFIYDVDFSNSIFEDDVEILDSQFKGEANFGGSDFVNTEFKKYVSFKGSIFNEKSNFSYTSFYEECRFEMVGFKQEVFFRYCSFDKLTIFDGTKFLNGADFNSSIFNGITFFSQLKDTLNLNLSLSKFKQEVNFTSSKIKGVCDLSFTKFEDKVNFNRISFDTLLLSDCENYGIIDLNGVKKIDKLSLKTIRNFGIVLLTWENFLDDEYFCIKDSILNYKWPEVSEISRYINYKEQFRFIKRIFSSNENYDAEDKSYYVFKKAERKELLQKVKKRNLFIERIKIFISYLLDLIGGYGTKPEKVFISIPIVIIFFAFIIFVSSQIEYNNDCTSCLQDIKLNGNIINEADNDNNIDLTINIPSIEVDGIINDNTIADSILSIPIIMKNDELNIKASGNFVLPKQSISLSSLKDSTGCNSSISFQQRFLDSLYLSGVTFFTVGFGDISPKTTWGKILSIIEAFVGLFLMSYFTIAFSRKVLR